jgi:23S rRNA (uracil1939-C5)-methyltransferase
VGSRRSRFPKHAEYALQSVRDQVRLKLAITSIAPGGQGVAHVQHGDERRAVFVPRAAPGDVLEAQIDFDQRPARGEMVRLLEPSTWRAPAPCPLVEKCGGCDLMHLTRDAQRDVHRSIVSELIERSTKTPSAALEFHAAPSATRYRTRARLAVLAGRGRAVVGYRRAASRHIEQINACLVLDERLEPALPLLQEIFAEQVGDGEVAIALGAAGRPVLDVRWRGDLSGTFYGALGRHVEAGALAGAEVWIPGAREPSRVGDPRALTIAADGEPLIVPAGGFAQAHPALNVTLGRAVLAASVLEEARAADANRPVVELFAGSGNFTVLLARHAPTLVAVESDARAARAARENLDARGIRARVVEGDADAFDLPPQARTVVLDPPRTGAPGAVRRIASSKVRRVVYVSCDAATLARDVETLAGSGFQLVRAELFEMFPHTSHVEVVAALERDPNARP